MVLHSRTGNKRSVRSKTINLLSSRVQCNGKLRSIQPAFILPGINPLFNPSEYCVSDRGIVTFVRMNAADSSAGHSPVVPSISVEFAYSWERHESISYFESSINYENITFEFFPVLRSGADGRRILFDKLRRSGLCERKRRRQYHRSADLGTYRLRPRGLLLHS